MYHTRDGQTGVRERSWVRRESGTWLVLDRRAGGDAGQRGNVYPEQFWRSGGRVEERGSSATGSQNCQVVRCFRCTGGLEE